MRPTDDQGGGQEAAWQTLSQHLDAALASLPAAFRDVLVACYVNGWTQAEAARVLGMNPGTVGVYARRGIERLRSVLRRRGVPLASAALGAMLLENAAPAAELPAGLVAGTLAAAKGTVSSSVAALAQGTLQAMFLAKLKVAVIGLTAAACLPIAAVPVVRLAREAEDAGPRARDEVRTGAVVEAQSREAAPGNSGIRGQVVFSRDFDAIPETDRTPNDLVRLAEPGGEVTAIASRPFTDGTGTWRPDVHIELVGAPQDGGGRKVLYAFPENVEVGIRIKAERPGKCGLCQMVANPSFKPEHFYSEFEVGPQWRVIKLRATEMKPYRTEGYTRDLRPGVGIDVVYMVGFGTGKILCDEFVVATLPDA